MNVYKIRDWSLLFETCETRKLAHLRWVPVPNKHDGKSFRRIASMKNACEIFTAWMLILQIASKCVPRGTLIDGDKPIEPEDMAIMTGFPEKIFSEALTVLSNGKIDWLHPVNPGEHPGKQEDSGVKLQDVDNQPSPESSGEPPGIPGGPPVEGKEGSEGNVRKEKKRHESLTSNQNAAKEVLDYLNEKTGATLPHDVSLLRSISFQLNKNHSVADLKLVIDYKVNEWGKKPDFVKNLVPSILFKEGKFLEYLSVAKMSGKVIKPKVDYVEQNRMVAELRKKEIEEIELNRKKV